jgi:hypothetical protein
VNREQETGNREQGTEYKFIYFLLPSFFFLLPPELLTPELLTPELLNS